MKWFGSYPRNARQQAYTRRVEDHSKVEDKLRELNGGKVGGDWDEVGGLHMLPAVTQNPITRGYKPDASSGFLVKLFVNKVTGKMEVCWADKFFKTIDF